MTDTLPNGLLLRALDDLEHATDEDYDIRIDYWIAAADNAYAGDREGFMLFVDNLIDEFPHTPGYLAGVTTPRGQEAKYEAARRQVALAPTDDPTVRQALAETWFSELNEWRSVALLDLAEWASSVVLNGGTVVEHLAGDLPVYSAHYEPTLPDYQEFEPAARFEGELGDPVEDVVNHPSHYQSKTGLESIDVIEAFDLGFHLGNAVKYILRAGKKDDRTQDLSKAIWYLNRELNK